MRHSNGKARKVNGAERITTKGENGNLLPLHMGPRIIPLPGWPSPHETWMEYVDLRKLKSAPYNPKEREITDIINLASSILTIGLLSMICLLYTSPSPRDRG